MAGTTGGRAVSSDGTLLGGTTTPGSCLDTPFDLCARVAELEYLMSQLLGVDVTAISLSDITQDMGNITGGTFGGGVLADLILNYLRSNPYAMSGGSNALDGDGQYTDAGMGNMWQLQTGNTLNAFAGISNAGAAYTFWGGFYDGGFLFQTRVGFFPMSGFNRSTILPKCRFFAGLGDSLFRNFAANNSDNPPCNAIAFNYSQPRGDTTWHLIANGKTGPIVGPSPMTVYNTGVPILTFHWYDLTLKNVPGSGTVAWTVADVTSKTSVSGSIPTPTFYANSYPGFGSGIPAPADEMLYYAGVGAFNTTASNFGPFGIHHIFCQSLSLDRP